MSPRTDNKENIRDIAVILTRLDNQDKMLDQISKKLDSDYVSMDRYRPVEKITYGIVSVILLTVVGSILGLVLVMKH